VHLFTITFSSPRMDYRRLLGKHVPAATIEELLDACASTVALRVVGGDENGTQCLGL
jgi:hypothetical protein